MDKVKKYLEQYVEWLAVALGVAFLLWNVYGYVIKKPVTVSVGANASVTPGEVDKTIWDEKGSALQEAVGSKAVPPLPKVVDVATTVQSSLADNSNPQFASALSGWFTPLSVPMNTGPAADTTGPSIAKVISLPVPPAIVDLRVSGGHSNVPAPQPIDPATGAPAVTPSSNQVLAVDKSWRTIGGRIPISQITKAFVDAKIPTGLMSTAVLRVQLFRQERDAAGNWGSDTEVPPLSINVMNPLPTIEAAPGDQVDYEGWAEKNTALIMRPPFFTVLHGDVWYVPGTKSPNEVQVQMVAFDPSTFTGDPATLSPEDKAAFDAYKEKLRKDAAAARRAGQQNRSNSSPYVPPGAGFNPGGDPSQQGGPPTGASHGSGRGSGHGRSGLAADPDRSNTNFPPPNFAPPGGMPPWMQQGAQQQPPQAGIGADDPSLGALPAGAFNPAGQVDIVVWAHDDTVQAGKTYRYKLRYLCSSPVARSVGLCDPQSLASKFYLQSPFSAWTDPVSVESDTNFYATKVNPSRNQVTFDVFLWKDGIWQMQTVTVSPGDMVGGLDTVASGAAVTGAVPGGTPGGKIDFSTGWTVVDVRTDRDDNSVILLTSDNGTVLKKESSTDLRNSEYHKLLDLVNKDKPKTASAQ